MLTLRETRVQNSFSFTALEGAEGEFKSFLEIMDTVRLLLVTQEMSFCPGFLPTYSAVSQHLPGYTFSLLGVWNNTVF